MIRYLFPLCLLFVAELLPAANLPPGFVEVPVATGLDPTAMAQAPDGRIFITEKYGAVRIVENGVLLPDPFIQLDVDNYNERGLSGIAFHPDFAQNGYVYLYYTVQSAGHNRLSRVQAVGNYAIPGSEEVLLELDPLAATVHNAGAMAFGADGKLYVATGEGADGAKSPLLTSLLGKVLRLNPDGTIPGDNPFFNEASGPYRAIYATGFRNPFSLTVQPGSGRILVGDVGGSYFEEINDVKAGQFYGWDILEGKRTMQQVPANYRDPLYTYSHNIGCAVTGVAFYDQAILQFPATYHGKVFFSDYCNKKITVLNPATGLVEGTFASAINRPLGILAGHDGALYYLARGGIGGGSELDNTSSGNGILWRVSYVGNGAPVFSVQPVNTLVPAGEDAFFSVQANGTPVINYQWQRDGQDIPGATAPELVLNQTTLPDSGAVIRCRATNPFGQVLSQEAVLRVTTNQRPTPEILTPAAGYQYAAGDTIWFSGQALDPETGLLPADDLVWWLDFHHDQHTHPGLAPLGGVSSGFYVVPRVGETADNVWLRLYLRASDPAGLSQTVYREFFPKKTKLRLESSPSGLPMRIDGNTYVTPFEITSVQGLLHQIQATPAIQDQNKLTVLANWSDGETSASRLQYADDPVTTLRAVYETIEFKGTGMYGQYHTLTDDLTFDQLVFNRVDTMINFNWGQGAPNAGLPTDFFAVRWLGYIEPAFSEAHFFHAKTDDGFRLWVDGQLIMDEWYPKGASEFSKAVFLEKGKRYPIELEYFEVWGEAVAVLSWSSASMPKEVIPKWRLYPRLPENPGLTDHRFDARLFPNPVTNRLSLLIEADFRETFDLRLFDAAGRMVREWRHQVVEIYQEQLSWPVSDLQAGSYWLELTQEGRPPVIFPFIKI
ncbi:MAG: PQQ-dependent sugar dehydrogenase [Lewinellaceae bacterium]|nr:PQQ-dependent sugar dehydrogenase [Lewinellaceae bacterium]